MRCWSRARIVSILGIITQTDLLAVLTRLASTKAFDLSAASAA